MKYIFYLYSIGTYVQFDHFISDLLYGVIGLSCSGVLQFVLMNQPGSDLPENISLIQYIPPKWLQWCYRSTVFRFYINLGVTL